jgi:hypothetical protein
MAMLEALAISEPTQGTWADFLTRRTDPTDPTLLDDAEQAADVTDPRHHIHVIARSTLLLRVATGASAQLLSGASINAENLKFWWEPLGRDRGLWDPDELPDDLTALWDDADLALDDLAGWRAGPPVGDSFFSLRHNQADAIAVLSECERIAFWGLGL